MTLALTGWLLVVVLANGLGVFWPKPIALITLDDGSKILGELVETDRSRGKDAAGDDASAESLDRAKYKCGNREDGEAFRWINLTRMEGEPEFPEDAYKLDRMSNLNYYGFLKELDTPHLEIGDGAPLPDRLTAAIDAARLRRTRTIEPIEEEEAVIARELTNDIDFAILDAKYDKKQLLLAGVSPDDAEVAALDAELKALEQREETLKDQSHDLTVQRLRLEGELLSNVAVFVDSAGREKRIPLTEIVRFSRPNAMGVADKASFYAAKVWEMLADDPREANQDGGLFPAIFGTVLMVFLMAITCFPLGVLAGIYLGEYAKEGPLVRTVRIAVNNLAGIPSIVYGIFGLGFFIYICGGYLDEWLFPARVDASKPVFGQGCIFWASLTLGLLTIPVVIVSTEEALRAIPRGVREGSYALGATKFQTLRRVLVPMASPGMMTGFILAMARAAGEVAPLMITGAVKSAPVPLSGDAPFVHLERQFMHLGFHIFDISCKSPNVEATKPMVYVTTLLLLFIVLSMSSLAIWLRNRMRKQFQSRAI